MPAISLDVSDDDAGWGRRVGLHRLTVLHTTEDWKIKALRGGMKSGATSLTVTIPVAVGARPALVVAETSLTAWMMTASGLASAFEEEVTRPGWAVLSPEARAVLEPRYAEAVRRAIPQATEEQARAAAVMILDSVGADAPGERP